MPKGNTQRSADLPEGYSARAASWKDLESIEVLANLAALKSMGAEDTSREEIRMDWEDPNFNLEKDSQLVFSKRGKLVGMAEIFKFQNPPVRPYLWLVILPGEEHSGVGDYLLKWGELIAMKVIPLVEEKARVSMITHNVSGYPPLQKLLEGYRMQLMRHSFQMRIELEEAPPDPIWPDGIHVGGFDETEDLEAVYRANEEAFRDHFGAMREAFEAGFARFKHHMLSDEGYDPSLWFIARDGDEIAGVSLCRKFSLEDKEMGWVVELSVRRPWRRRGLGLALLQHSFVEYYRRGFRRVGLGVDASSLTGATRLYDRAGMLVHRQYDRYEKELRAGEELTRTELED